ncbi:NACHT domain-containing protein [Virgisporangium aurantiacum]|uniref:NACHT domain-containing protein n=1 Tax=Virgisporangium aurantiacum TaxID=175570 RepID=UPI001950A259|nr:NACHT domain-containing protein [Virgisporangium aurantiacum]
MLVVTITGFGVVVATGGIAGLRQAQQVGAAAAAVAALVTPLLAWLWRYGSVGSHEQAVERVSAALRSLAVAQREQWSMEQSARQVQDPWPLPVRWAVTARAQAVMASWGAIRGAPRAGALRLDGTFEGVADVFSASDSPGRLVIVGEPGSGKSTLVVRLALDLLDRWLADGSPRSPVPVIFSVAGWDPHRPLLDWLAGRLATDNRALTQPVRAASGAVRTLAWELVASGKVLPILDGLDEMAADHRPDALVAAAGYLSSGQQLVLTSRIEEYERATAQVGPLARTPVVELLPLMPADVVSYLHDGVQQPERWNGVFEHLRHSPDGPLAAALATPLMTWLARSVYHNACTTPSELLTTPYVAGREAVERHLLGRVVRAVYTGINPVYGQRSPEYADRAQRWLTKLARRLQIAGTFDIAWWRLDQMVSPVGLSLMIGLASAGIYLAARLATDLPLLLDDEAVGFVPATLAATLIIGIASTVAAMVPRSASWPGWAFGCVIAVLAATWFHLRYEHVTWISPVGSGLLYGLVYSVLSIKAAAPRRLDLNIDRARLLLGVKIYSVATLVVGFALLIVNAYDIAIDTVLWAAVLGIGVLPALFAVFVGSHQTQRAPSPGRLLREDRNFAVMSVLATGLLFLILGIFSAYKPQLGLSLGLALAATVSPWGRFTIIKIILAAQLDTPLRLISALQEAHHRGLLRQTGGVYQFRHARLQDQLALSADRPAHARHPTAA